jgi:hypothetical protein
MPVRRRTAADVIELLQEQAARVRADEAMSGGDRARTIGYLSSVALRAIEVANVEGRLAALEAVLKARPEDPR